LKWLSQTLAIIRRTIVSVGERVRAFLPFGKRVAFRLARVDEIPDILEDNRLYVAGEGPNVWAAAMLCPCGCGDRIELNLLQQVRPRWQVFEHPIGFVTLKPSVWRRKGCKSHFIVREGRIIWCT